MAAKSPDYYLRAVARITGDPGRPGTHVRLYRITVTSTDGKKCGVTIRVSEKRVYENTRRQIANSLRLELDDLDAALEGWTPDDTRQHLEQYPAEVLDSPADDRLFTQQAPPPSTSNPSA